jgi:hypothetical protein
MMLHDREHDLIALSDLESRAVGDQIDRLCGVAREDDLVGRFRIHEGTHPLAGALEILRRRIRQIMQAAMDIGVFVAVGVGDRIDDLARLLGGSGIVEIDQRLAVDFPRRIGKSRRIASTSS